MNSDRFDAKFTARALHAQCNLAPVGNQDLFEHFESLANNEQRFAVFHRLPFWLRPRTALDWLRKSACTETDIPPSVKK